MLFEPVIIGYRCQKCDAIHNKHDVDFSNNTYVCNVCGNYHKATVKSKFSYEVVLTLSILYDEYPMEFILYETWLALEHKLIKALGGLQRLNCYKIYYSIKWENECLKFIADLT